MNLKFTKEELLSGIWTEVNKEGSVVAQKAIDFDNLTMELVNTSQEINFSKRIEGLTKNETNYLLEFKASPNPMGGFELKRFHLLGSDMNLAELTKEDVQQVLDTFTFDFKNMKQKINNFTNLVDTPTTKRVSM